MQWRAPRRIPLQHRHGSSCGIRAADRRTIDGGRDDRGDALVVYYSATGTTKNVAEKIARVMGADVYEITAAQPYTSADLNWNDRSSRSTREQNDPDARPELGSRPASLDQYETIYIGYPIWWGEAPRIVDTFVESEDFGDATVIPFCTSGGSGVGNSAKRLADLAGSGRWHRGYRLTPSVMDGKIESLGR